MSNIRCVVERITYQNPENGYSVIKVKVKDYTELVTVVGNLLDVNVGSVLLIEGSWKNDARYGRQFAAVKWEETMPATLYGIEKYLGSGLIKGIGPAFAKRIVSLFGTDTIDVIEENPDRLLEVEGIGEKRVARIKESWEKQKEIKNIMLFLQSHDVSTAHASKIYKTYGNESIEKVRTNPFCLADDIWGIGFKTADTIASKLGFDKDCFVRVRSGIQYSLNELANDGHVYAVKDQLLDTCAQLLEISRDAAGEVLESMIKSGDLIIDGEAIYLPPFYYAETGVAARLKALACAESSADLTPEAAALLCTVQSDITYDEVQLDAIGKALTSKVMVLTGGPGTGKTTTTRGIISAFRAQGKTVLLAAPTGRAAKRMSEATGMDAKTIHRLLEFKPPEGYQKNEDNPLTGDVLIVDEASMIDVILMNSLLKAIPLHMHLLLVGDTNQLPSVGPGNVLRDIIASGVFPVVTLKRIFRQAMSSRIIMNAHRINEGKFPDISNGRNSDFFFIEDGDGESIARTIVDLVKTRLPKAYGIHSGDIQVLAPMQRGFTGSANLNAVLQEALNPEGDCLRRAGVAYRRGDRVMQIKNNYDKEVFNGDIGVISSLSTENREFSVNYDGREVAYDAADLDELVLAYACTIHKSQGSEYPVVVLPVTMSHFVMLQRNLIYTGITRAKKLMVLIGEKKAVGYAVRNLTVVNRNTLLEKRLREFPE